MFNSLLSNLSPETIALVLGAIVANLLGSEAMKKGLGKLLGLASSGTSGLPAWVKRYVLPTVGGVLIAAGVGMTDAQLFDLLNTSGAGDVLVDGTVLSLLANIVFRLWKGKAQA